MQAAIVAASFWTRTKYSWGRDDFYEGLFHACCDAGFAISKHGWVLRVAEGPAPSPSIPLSFHSTTNDPCEGMPSVGSGSQAVRVKLAASVDSCNRNNLQLSITQTPSHYDSASSCGAKNSIYEDASGSHHHCQEDPRSASLELPAWSLIQGA